MYGGLNWNPALRAPLTEPGLNVKAGEYLLAVDSRPLLPPTNLYSAFENTAGKAIDLTVGPSADGKGARTITVVPVPTEDALRNRDWIEGNMRKVNAATGGKVAYVYVPNTAGLGHTYFKRYFFPQADKHAIIVDERFNGGGSVADYYIEILQKKEIAWWTMRYGADMKTPSASIQGPRAMLIDETAGSGGDLLPWMFRKNNMGPLIGKRDLGRPGGHPRLPRADGWRHHHGAEPGVLDARRRLGRGERRRAARYRSRADAGRRHRRPRSAAGKGDRGDPGRAGEEPAGAADASGVSGQEQVGRIRREAP